MVVRLNWFYISVAVVWTVAAIGMVALYEMMGLRPFNIFFVPLYLVALTFLWREALTD